MNSIKIITTILFLSSCGGSSEDNIWNNPDEPNNPQEKKCPLIKEGTYSCTLTIGNNTCNVLKGTAPSQDVFIDRDNADDNVKILKVIPNPEDCSIDAKFTAMIENHKFDYVGKYYIHSEEEWSFGGTITVDDRCIINMTMDCVHK